MITFDLVHDLNHCSIGQAVIINESQVFFGGSIHSMKILAFKCYQSSSFSQVIFKIASHDETYLLIKSFSSKKDCDTFIKKIVA
jgi:hypothetical protein